MTDDALRVRKWSRGHPACIVIEFTRDITNEELEAMPKALMAALHGDAGVVGIPTEPTESMVIAGFECESFDALDDLYRKPGDGPGRGPTCKQAAEAVRGIYRAMVAMAPAGRDEGMSRLPEHVTMKTTMYGDGAKGMAFQRAEDVADLGVLCEARRQDRRSPFREAWRYRWLPNRDFATYPELREAVNALDDATIQREREAWPKATEFESDSQNRCWLDGEPGALHITVQTSWCEYDSAPLCAACGELAKADPGVVVRAVAKREADVAARAPFASTSPERSHSSRLTAIQPTSKGSP